MFENHAYIAESAIVSGAEMIGPLIHLLIDTN